MALLANSYCFDIRTINLRIAMNSVVYKKDLVYPELSYKIVGCAYDLFNQTGGGHKEKIYQNGMALSFKKQKINFKEQLYFPVTFDSSILGKNYFDFLVEDKIVVELKSLSRFTKAHFDQVVKYLNVSDLHLALLINFTPNEVRCKRVVNLPTS